MSRRAASSSSGFTLLELVLVLMIIAIALAAATPSLRGWSRSSRLRDAGDQFLAVTRWTRTQAISNSRPYRLNVDSGAGRYWVTTQDGMEFVPVGTDFGQAFALPIGFGISVTDAASTQEAQTIDFFPTGRTQTATVRITSDDGFEVNIVCETPAEGFALVQ